MARPKIEIDAAEVEKLAQFGLTDTEIAQLFGIHKSNIGRRFATELAKGRAALRKSLRRKQVEMALKGDRVMLIWLGKQYLGQAEKQETKVTDGDIDAEIERELARVGRAKQSPPAQSPAAENGNGHGKP